MQPKQVDEAADRAQAEVPKLGAGFVVVTDLCEVESMDIDCCQPLTRMMDIFFSGASAR